jgi:hypothetical protein
MVEKCEGSKDLGMKEIKDPAESRGKSSEMQGISTEWRDWSLQLTENNEFLITGKTSQ